MGKYLYHHSPVTRITSRYNHWTSMIDWPAVKDNPSSVFHCSHLLVVHIFTKFDIWKDSRRSSLFTGFSNSQRRFWNQKERGSQCLEQPFLFTLSLSLIYLAWYLHCHQTWKPAVGKIWTHRPIAGLTHRNRPKSGGRICWQLRQPRFNSLKFTFTLTFFSKEEVKTTCTGGRIFLLPPASLLTGLPPLFWVLFSWALFWALF